MGKAFKRWKNRLAAEGKLVPREPPHKGPCSFDGCGERGGQIFHCSTCEELVRLGKRKEENVFQIQACVFHAELARAKVTAHGLLAHPVNIFRVGVELLKGRGEP